MKRITILVLLNLSFVSTIIAQAPYVIYYAVDELYAYATDVPQNAITNVYLSYPSENAGLLSNFRPGLYTSVDRSHLVDNEVKGGYIFEDYGRQPTNELASYRNDDKAYQRVLEAYVKSTYTQSPDIVHPGHSATIVRFDNDMPKAVNFTTTFDFAGSNGQSIKLNYGIKGTFAMVAQANTYPKLVSPSNAQLPYVSTQFATISVPEFFRYFPEDQIGWYQDDKEINGVTGYILTLSKEIPELLPNKCGLHSYKPFLKDPKFKNWVVGAIQVELSPNLALGKDIIINQPFCVENQKNKENFKAMGYVLSTQTLIYTYKANFYDRNNEQSEFTLSKMMVPKYLSVDKGPYVLTLETEFGNNRTSCKQTIINIQITPPKPISVAEPSFHDIRCFGDKSYIDLNIDGNTTRYTLAYGDSTKTLVRGQNQNIALMRGTRDYAFTLSDSNGCVYEQALNFKAKEPSKLEASFNIVDALCHDGNASISISAKGGTPYLKESAYRYSYTPTLAELSTSSIALKAGTTLSMGLHDAQGCTISFADTTLHNPADFRLLVLQKQENICPKGNNASVLLSAASTDKAYRYAYSKDGKSYSDESLFAGLHSGTINLHAQNQHGCIRDTSITFTEPPSITIGKKAVDSVRCHGESNGAITLDVAGGTGSKKVWMEGARSGQAQGLQAYRFLGLADKTYKFYAQDSLGCLDSASYNIGTRSKIEHIPTVLNPACNESKDGALKILNLGGKGNYQNDWLFPEGLGKSLVQENLGKGTYILRSVDALGCSKTDTFTLTAPPMLQVDLQGYPLLCKGQHLELDAGIVAPRYEWSGTKGFKANTKVVRLTETDTYTLKVTNGFGCTGTDTFELKTSDTVFNAYFVVATHVVQGDTVVLVNHNAPIDSLVWNLNPSNTITLPKLPDFRSQHVVFREQGEQEVQMTGYYKGCRDIIKKKVIVIDPKDRIKYDNAIGIKTSVIKSCGLFPNPNDGSFSVHIELHDADVPVALVLSSTTTGSILKQLDWKLYPYGKIDFTEDLPEGPYVLHIKVRDEVVALRFLVAFD